MQVETYFQYKNINCGTTRIMKKIKNLEVKAWA